LIDQQDRKFARNLDLPFKTPEMLFFGHEDVEFQWGSIDPSTIPKGTRTPLLTAPRRFPLALAHALTPLPLPPTTHPLTHSPDGKPFEGEVTSDSQEMILCVGFPAVRTHPLALHSTHRPRAALV
jgi:hypothetical protein